MQTRVGVVGAGLIGRAWAIVFARAGVPVRLYDVDEQALAAARDALRHSLDDLAASGLIGAPQEVLSRIRFEADLTQAMADVDYVQECGPENLEAKRQIYVQLEAAVASTTILASSTSGIAASRFTDHLQHPERCLVAHPVNPPYLIPLVEVVPTPDTTEAVVERTLRLMEAVDQAPILVRREVQGFILNRLQGALLNEALRLFRDGYVSAADLDKTVKHGLGLRWSFMGPFETIDLNAPRGVVDYGRRYGPLYQAVDGERGGDDPWEANTLTRLDAERRHELPAAQLAERQAWRDRRLMALIAHQRALGND
ncbi:3-hydroxyacyl-CoA dehydrogenase [Halomonas campisalis]|uniref:3-hydroxyacyl-CoA dehydrogenase n=1 Tax=Billgrantia campisalis TaxID=74661 RepID=A0ABS9P8W7_9GAMM|nr:3-hydroxyacyl-CoA dehydrogenase [Halomonas campisalis]MCG6658221.1 3-hydroxyacyl-CoA dehydrogenase [Halomonas campisalis]MDR5862889.1 3-hydroxyacyl-CoA dehydrogenase [Halomonas campisalis]